MTDHIARLSVVKRCGRRVASRPARARTAISRVLNITNPAYLPEELTDYEAGLKTEFFDKRTRVNLSEFYYDYINIQVIRFTNGIQTVVNGAGAEVYGLDVDDVYEVARGLRLSGGFEVEHAEFTAFPGAVFSTPKPTGGPRCSPARPRASASP